MTRGVRGDPPQPEDEQTISLANERLGHGWVAPPDGERDLAETRTDA